MDDFGITEGYGDVVEEAMEGPGVWLHVPARGSLTVVLLRSQPVRYEAHWIDGRVKPCPGRERCALHAKGIGGKVRYVYSVFATTISQAGLVEVSPQTAGEIARACQDAGFSRGLAFGLRKEAGKVNGRIVATCMHSILRDEDLPEGPDPGHVLRKQWSLPEVATVRPSENPRAAPLGL